MIANRATISRNLLDQQSLLGTKPRQPSTRVGAAVVFKPRTFTSMLKEGVLIVASVGSSGPSLEPFPLSFRGRSH